MAATFLKVQGYQVGLSLVEEDKFDLAKQLIDNAKRNEISLVLPIDVVGADSISEQAIGDIISVGEISPTKYITDIGPQTIVRFSQQLSQCCTVFWNGPMGVYEIPQFAKGTKDLVELLTNLKGKTIIGGGSTADIVGEMGMTDKMTHISTGGGASLKFLEGKNLPGVDVLLDK